MGKYRLMSGDHTVTDVTRDANGRVTGESTRVVNAGAEIESDQDLCAMFNRPGVRPKFEPLHAGGQVSGHVWNPSAETLDAFAQRMRTGIAQQPAPVPFPQGDSAPRQAPPIFEPASPHGGATTAVASMLSEAQMAVMGIDQLRAHCEAEEIPFDPSSGKPQLVELVRAFQGGS